MKKKTHSNTKLTAQVKKKQAKTKNKEKISGGGTMNMVFPNGGRVVQPGCE
jgi:hypothetical protein